MRTSFLAILLGLVLVSQTPVVHATECDINSFNWEAYLNSVSTCINVYLNAASGCGSSTRCACNSFDTYAECLVGSSGFCFADSLRESLVNAKAALAEVCDFAERLYTYVLTFNIAGASDFSSISSVQRTIFCRNIVQKMGYTSEQSAAICAISGRFTLTFNTGTRRATTEIIAEVKIQDTVPPSLDGLSSSVSIPYTTTGNSESSLSLSPEPNIQASSSSSAFSLSLSLSLLLASLVLALAF